MPRGRPKIYVTAEQKRQADTLKSRKSKEKRKARVVATPALATQKTRNLNPNLQPCYSDDDEAFIPQFDEEDQDVAPGTPHGEFNGYNKYLQQKRRKEFMFLIATIYD